MARTDIEIEIADEALAAGRAPAPVIDDIVGMEQFNSLPRRILVVYLPLAVFVFVLLFPFYWMAITAIKPDHQLTNYTEYSPFWVVGPTLEHIKYLFLETSYPGWLWNTMIVAFASTVLALAASVFAAYAIERVRFTGARVTGLLIFLAYLVPPSILFIPLAFIVFKVGHLRLAAGADPDLPDLPHPLLHLAADGLLPHHPLRARGERAGRRRLALADPDPGDPAAGGAGPDLRRHLRLHPLLERVHLRADLHLLLGEQDRAGRRADRARPRRHLRMGRADVRARWSARCRW